MPSSARAPADVAPSATVVGFGRMVAGDFAGPVADDFLVLDDALIGVAGAAGLGGTLDVSCAAEVADSERTDIASASVQRDCLRGMNTATD